MPTFCDPDLKPSGKYACDGTHQSEIHNIHGVQKTQLLFVEVFMLMQKLADSLSGLTNNIDDIPKNDTKNQVDCGSVLIRQIGTTKQSK